MFFAKYCNTIKYYTHVFGKCIKDQANYAL